MKELKILLVTTILLSVASCIDAAPRDAARQNTSPQIPYSEQVVNNWTGLPVSRIIKQWRVPDKTLRIAGKEYIVYEVWTTATYVNPGSSGYYNYGRSSPSSSHQTQRLECTYNFEIARGIIVGGNVTGNKHSKWCADGS